MIGSGGVLAELTRDTRTLLLPAPRAEIRRALLASAAGQLIAGYRGGRPGDLEAAVDACAAIAGFAAAHADTLVELDVNPLLVRPEGEGAVAADALVRLAAPADAAAPARGPGLTPRPLPRTGPGIQRPMSG
ncbi:MAG: acetate--CoA ligase family protein [Halofilum sp. (in: g-proteobacteria)]|nr:acetate--CoA ligase family protein [Halofilum sp. (in: g-proteobacteria)]